MRLAQRLPFPKRPAIAEAEPAQPGARRGFFAFLRRNMTRKLAAALTIWRIEARTATPLAILLVATLGRWTGALVDGLIMACLSALFLFLLDGQRAVDDVRGWARERRWTQRYLLPIAERQDRTGFAQRALALPASIMLLGPFWRALTYHLFRLPRLPAYVLSV